MAKIATTDEVNSVLTDIFRTISQKIDQNNLGVKFDNGDRGTKMLCGTITQAQLLGRNITVPDFDTLLSANS